MKKVKDLKEIYLEIRENEKNKLIESNVESEAKYIASELSKIDKEFRFEAHEKGTIISFSKPVNSEFVSSLNKNLKSFNLVVNEKNPSEVFLVSKNISESMLEEGVLDFLRKSKIIKRGAGALALGAILMSLGAGVASASQGTNMGDLGSKSSVTTTTGGDSNKTVTADQVDNLYKQLQADIDDVEKTKSSADQPQEIEKLKKDFQNKLLKMNKIAKDSGNKDLVKKIVGVNFQAQRI